MKKLKKTLTALLCVTLACALVACGKKQAVEQHNWDEGVVTVAPTCGTAGERLYTCLDCGETYTEVIEPTGQHVFQSGNSSYLATEPTADTEGERLAMCQKCKQLAVRSTVTYEKYQSDVARATGIDQRTISNYETGKSNPDSFALIKLADFFGVSVDYLLGRTNIDLYASDDKRRAIENIQAALDDLKRMI